MMETEHLLDKVRKGEENTKISELGNQYTNIYSIHYQVIDGLSFACPCCNNMQKYKHNPETRMDTYVLCENCYECEENNALKELKWHCEAYDFNIQQSIIDDYIEKYKIKINDYYCVLRITADMESNSWSRNPRDIYVSTYYIFSDEHARDQCYEAV